MRTIKKLLAVALSFSIVMSVAACSTSGGNSGDTKVEATAATTEALDAVDWGNVAADTVDENSTNGTGKLYEAGKVAGKTTALCYYDIASLQPELAKLYAERFGGTLESTVVSSGEYLDKLATNISAGDSPDIIRYDWEMYPWGISRNIIQPLDDWLDMDSPVWADEKNVIEQFNYGGKHYYYPSKITTNFAIIFNRTVVEEAGLQDPMELYNAGDWNWNTFEQLIRKWCDQGEDYIGFTGGSWSGMMFANTTGTKIIDVTGSDIINNIGDQNVQRTMDWLSGLKKEGFIGDGYVDPSVALNDGKLLFLGMGLEWGFESAEEGFYRLGVESDVCAIPFPRDPNADKYYITGETEGFMVPSGAKNVQSAIDWILCGRIYATDPEIVAQDYAEKTDKSIAYYAKCPDCKYNFVENGTDDLDACPECGAARKQKFKPYYSPEQMQIIKDMTTDGDKFSIIFEDSVGFGSDVASLLKESETSLFDGPIYYGASFTQLRDEYYNTLESYIEPFRELIKEASK